MAPPDRAHLPGPPPLPPGDLAKRRLPLLAWDRSRALFRIHRTVNDPIWFGRDGSNRWDAPNSEYGVLYVGTDLAAAFAETFLRRPGVSLVSQSEIDARALNSLRLSTQVDLVDMTGPGLARIGATAAAIHGNYSVTQAWSYSLWAHPEQPDGLLYQSRHDPSVTCIALFDRTSLLITAGPKSSLTASLLAPLIDRYDVALIP